MSNIYEYIKMAIHNIMANKGRSFLTMLGIIIGIASVIAIVSIGEGTKNQMKMCIRDSTSNRDIPMNDTIKKILQMQKTKMSMVYGEIHARKMDSNIFIGRCV